MFRTVLVANRGEIACRVMATLRERGIRSVAVYSDADAESPHVRLADQAVRIGPPEPKRSYLDIEALLAAAKSSGAEAIHPGYGFLAESAAFAEAVEKAGLVFIGPTPEQARRFGDKRQAREAAERAGVPIVPGFEAPPGAKESEFRAAAERLGFPVLVKAALGGGGKGMRAVGDPSELAEALESARRVAAAAFGEGSVYLEKLLEHPRHVEVQIMGDGRDRVLHFFERECSLQRRHQKVLEETPSPGIPPDVRNALYEAATALARSVHYRGAGTVEFLVLPDGRFYFLEVNTRLQVEHPVTELITGVDLVWLQLVVAAEKRLPFEQEGIARRGHAVEVRLYAEDPSRDFLPQSGRLTRVTWPRGPFVRVDAGVESGGEVTVHYDPILAKIVVWGADRQSSLDRLAKALDSTVIHGVTTNLDFLRGLVRDEAVRAGAFDTTYLESQYLPRLPARNAKPAPALALAAIALAEELEAGETASSADASEEEVVIDPFVSLGDWRLPGLQ